MKDSEIIQAAYAAALEGLYKTMFLSYVGAGGNEDGEKKADGAFSAGLAVARAVRDRALALL
jgi:hypothetical protein